MGSQNDAIEHATTRETISVAIASYNGARHIGAQLESIAAQTVLPDEIVVADDASTDTTVEVVERFATTADVPVRIVRHDRNVGILENFYSAFDATTGDLVFYCDQDDVWSEDKVAKVLQAFEPGVTMVTHQSDVTDGELVSSGRIEPGNPVYGRLAAPVDSVMVYSFGHQAAFRRTVLDLMTGLRAIGSPSTATMSDCFDPLIPFCAGLLGDIAVLPDPLTRFRRHEHATTGAGIDRAGPESRAGKVARVAAQDEYQSELRITLIDEAVAHGLIDREAVAATRRAFEKKRRLAEQQRRLLGTPPLRRLRDAPAAVVQAIAGTGFSNDRRGRAAAMTALAALSG